MGDQEEKEKKIRAYIDELYEKYKDLKVGESIDVDIDRLGNSYANRQQIHPYWDEKFNGAGSILNTIVGNGDDKYTLTKERG